MRHQILTINTLLKRIMGHINPVDTVKTCSMKIHIITNLSLLGIWNFLFKFSEQNVASISSRFL